MVVCRIFYFLGYVHGFQAGCKVARDRILAIKIQTLKDGRAAGVALAEKLHDSRN